MTDNELREEYQHQARRADLDGNPLAGILIACACGLAMWIGIYLVWWR